jgi:uncharacterized protein with PIN domain
MISIIKCPVCGYNNLESRGSDVGEKWETMEFYYCPQCDDQFTLLYHFGTIYDKMQDIMRKKEQQACEEDFE